MCVCWVLCVVCCVLCVVCCVLCVVCCVLCVVCCVLCVVCACVRACVRACVLSLYLYGISRNHPQTYKHTHFKRTNLKVCLCVHVYSVCVCVCVCACAFFIFCIIHNARALTHAHTSMRSVGTIHKHTRAHVSPNLHVCNI